MALPLDVWRKMEEAEGALEQNIVLQNMALLRVPSKVDEAWHIIGREENVARVEITVDGADRNTEFATADVRKRLFRMSEPVSEEGDGALRGRKQIE
jgi:hypothetical protein